MHKLFRLLVLATISCFGATDTFDTIGTQCLDVYNSTAWLSFNKGSGTDCLAKVVSGPSASIRNNDTRTSQVSGYLWVTGDAGTRTDQATQLVLTSRRTAAAKGCSGAIVRATYTDSTHFNGYAAVWCAESSATDTIRLLRFAANGSANATLTDITTEITSWTWAADDVLLLSAVGTSVRVRVVRSGTAVVDTAVTDTTYTVGRSGILGITYTGTDHDGARVDTFSSYNLPELPRSWYVSTAGTSTNGGGVDDPWSLSYALQKGTAQQDNCAEGWVKAGDTIVLRGGTYTLTAEVAVGCQGTYLLPIRIVSYLGESPIIDGVSSNTSTGASHYLFNMTTSTYTTVQSLPASRMELFSSATQADSRTTTDSSLSHCPPARGGAIQTASGSKVFGLYIHDLCVGTSPNSTAGDMFVSGNIYLGLGFWSTNGTPSPQGQAMYLQNYSAWQRYYDNIVGNTLLQSMQCQGSGSSGTACSNILFVGNTLFQAGAIGGSAVADRNMLMGGNAPGFNNFITDNNCWHNSGLTGEVCITWYTRGTQGMTLLRNYIVATAAVAASSTSPSNSPAAFFKTMADNFLYGTVEAATTAAITNDTISGTRPSSGSVIRYRPGYIDPGDCFIAIYGWDGATTATPNLISGCGFASGDAYRIRDGQDYTTILASGTCTGTCTPTVATNRTVGQSFLGPNPQGATNPPIHTNASPDGRRFSVLIVERVLSTRTVKFQFDPVLSHPTTARVSLKYGFYNTAVTIDAVPMQVTITGRPAITIAAVTVTASSGNTLLYVNRSGVGPTYIPGNIAVTFAGGTGSCAVLNGSWTTVDGGSGNDFFRIPIEATGCTIGSLGSATVLYQAASPAIVLEAGPTPLITGDSITLSGGTSDWSCFNGTWTITTNNFHQFSGPTCTVTATTMSGTVPTARVGANPLTFDVRRGYFPPGTTFPVLISGFTGAWVGANGRWLATARANGRFSIPFNSAALSNPELQIPTITTPRALDFPVLTFACTARCSVDVPTIVGAMWYQWQYYDVTGTLLAESDRISITTP